MAGFKHRYIIIQIEGPNDVSSLLKPTLLKNIKNDFGDLVLSLIDCFEIVEYHSALNIAILRCNLSIYKYLCYSIVSTGKISFSNARISILHVSGILKKAKIAYLKSCKLKVPAIN